MTVGTRLTILPLFRSPALCLTLLTSWSFAGTAARTPYLPDSGTLAVLCGKPIDGLAGVDSVEHASLAAEYIGWQDRVGALMPRRCGDLIAARGDPLRGIERLQHVDVVIKGGMIFKAPQKIMP